MTCEELRPEYDAYALGIAEDPERGELDAHLARRCDACSRGIAQARSTVAALSGILESVAPPSGLRRRVLAMVAQDAPAREQKWSMPAWLPWATSVAFAVALAVVVTRPASVAPVNPDVAKLEQALSILNDPVTQDVSFGEPTARGRVFVSPSRGIVFIAAHLPKLDPGKTFQMWVIPAKGNPISAGTFVSAADASAIHLRPGPVTGAAAVAVTVEPAGGSMQPTSTPFIVTKL
jgi:anti-sigma-K factor RskA